jgi:DNA-binding HxlR family transcriptional regulator
MEQRTQNVEIADLCQADFILAINDTLNVITGKWKLPIIASLMFGKKRYSELQKSIGKITPRMLSKELKELEMNSIVTRKVQPTSPITVEYELTNCALGLQSVLEKMIEWGTEHRKAVISGK